MTSNSQRQQKVEQEAYIAVPASLSEEDKEVEDNEFSWSSCGESCLLAILPCLLFVQFGVAYLSDEPPQMHWMIVSCGIFAFIGAAVAFRRAFSDPESLVALVPEVLIDIILGLILFEKTEIAAAVMFGSIIGMSFVSGLQLFTNTGGDEEDDLAEPLLAEENGMRRGEMNA